jgi:hypothetical protein
MPENSTMMGAPGLDSETWETAALDPNATRPPIYAVILSRAQRSRRTCVSARCEARHA